MLVYSFLNPSDSFHYVKVSKGFLNYGTDAIKIAKERPDSFMYGNVLDVRIYKLDDKGSILENNLLKRIPLTTVKEGTFSSSGQVIYKSDLLILDPAFKYKVYVKNTISGLETSAETKIVQPLCFKAPIKGPFNRQDDCGPGDTLQEMPRTGTFHLTFHTVSNATIYEYYMDFICYEYHPEEPKPFKTDSFRWQFADPKHIDFDPNDENYIVQSFNENDFFNFLSKVIPYQKDPEGLTRKAGEIFFTVYASTPEMETYLKVVGTDVVLSQSKPEYTNVKNGLGLVTSRNKRFVRIKKFKELTLDSLIIKHPELKFRK